ncbi:hypothetical protein Tco_0758004, partial [Tanacetum coccineum]
VLVEVLLGGGAGIGGGDVFNGNKGSAIILGVFGCVRVEVEGDGDVVEVGEELFVLPFNSCILLWSVRTSGLVMDAMFGKEDIEIECFEVGDCMLFGWHKCEENLVEMVACSGGIDNYKVCQDQSSGPGPGK